MFSLGRPGSPTCSVFRTARSPSRKQSECPKTSCSTFLANRLLVLLKMVSLCFTVSPVSSNTDCPVTEVVAGVYPHHPPSPGDIQRYRAQQPRLTINVGGTQFEVSNAANLLSVAPGLQVMWRTFEPRILSRLGRLYRARTHEEIQRCVDTYSLQENCFYVGQ